MRKKSDKGIELFVAALLGIVYLVLKPKPKPPEENPGSETHIKR